MPAPFARSLVMDSDAAAYCARSGATDRAAINAFVRGVKALGLWSNMVCWPLRSSQNAGTGTTAYSLGGLGTFNGTLTNGPVWTTDGIVTDAINENVALPNDESLRNTRSAMVAFKTGDNALNQHLFEYQIGAGSGAYALFRFNGQNFDGIEQGIKVGITRNGVLSQNLNATRPINLNTWRTAFYTADDASDNLFENGNVSAGARTGLNAINPSGTPTTRHIFGNSLSMTGAFAMTTTAKWTDSQINTLHALYRQTLGTGLGLP